MINKPGAQILPISKLSPCQPPISSMEQNVSVDEENKVDLRLYLRILARNKTILLSTWLVVLSIVALSSFVTTPIYKSTATIYMWPMNERDPVFPIEEALEEKDSDAPEVRAAKITVKNSVEMTTISRNMSTMDDLYKVQMAFLKSKALVRETIRELNLDSNPNFIPQEKDNVINALFYRLANGFGLNLETNFELKRQYKLMKIFSESFDIGSPKNSNLVHISFKSKDKDLSHQIVEYVIKSLVNFTNRGYAVDNIRVVEPSVVANFSENYGNAPLNLGIGAIAGLVLGIFLVVLLEILRDRIRFLSDIKRIFGLDLLGVIPDIKNIDKVDKAKLLAYVDSQPDVSEAHLLIRTVLSSINNGNLCQILHFTSTITSTSKTISSVAIAMAFAKLKTKVLVIDCNLRQPGLHKLFAVENELGLTNYLTGVANYGEIVSKTVYPNLFIITSGTHAQAPADLLANQRTPELLGQAKQNFDLVILDGPPILDFADALILSKLSEGTIVIIDIQTERKKKLQYAIERLHDMRVPVMGAILNRCKSNRSDMDICY